MSTDTLKRFREQALWLSGAESKRHQRELLETMRADAVALIALASEIVNLSTTKRLEQLLDEIRAAADQVRTKTEASIAAVLALADEAARIWEAKRITRAQAAYARGEHEDMDNVLSRVRAGDPWLKD